MTAISAVRVNRIPYRECGRTADNDGPLASTVMWMRPVAPLGLTARAWFRCSCASCRADASPWWRRTNSPASGDRAAKAGQTRGAGRRPGPGRRSGWLRGNPNQLDPVRIDVLLLLPLGADAACVLTRVRGEFSEAELDAARLLAPGLRLPWRLRAYRRLDDLTTRELDVLRLVADGLTANAVGRRPCRTTSAGYPWRSVPRLRTTPAGTAARPDRGHSRTAGGGLPAQLRGHHGELVVVLA